MAGLMPRLVFCELTLGAIIALWGSHGTARADEPAEQSPADEMLDHDPQVRSLRFADRRQILMKLGLGGKFQDPLGDAKAKATYGATLRWDRPVHEYVSTGAGFSFYSSKPEDDFREPAFDISFVLKGRYPFEMGKRDRKFESEVYLISQIGLTIWIDSSSLTFDVIGPGWNVSVSLGYQFFINDRVGLLAEVGWVRTEALFSRGRVNVLLNQAQVLVGPVFPL